MPPLFDTHFHVLDHRFPLTENRGFAPPVFTVDGSDLPSQRARRPFAMSDIDLIREAVGEELAPAVLFDNAVSFYRPRVAPARDGDDQSSEEGEE